MNEKESISLFSDDDDDETLTQKYIKKPRLYDEIEEHNGIISIISYIFLVT